MSHPMQGKTLGERLAWEQELLDGKREGTIFDIEWLVPRLKVETGKFVYYMNKWRFRECSY